MTIEFKWGRSRKPPHLGNLFLGISYWIGLFLGNYTCISITFNHLLNLIGNV